MVVLTISADNNIEFSELLNSQLRITTQMKKHTNTSTKSTKESENMKKKTEKNSAAFTLYLTIFS